MLGTNDAKTWNWNATAYFNDYLDMSTQLIDISSKPKLYLLVPPPLYQEGAYGM
jgi:hypothetical protein